MPNAHQLCNAQRWVRASNVFILNYLLPRNFDEFVSKLPGVHNHLLMGWDNVTLTKQINIKWKVMTLQSQLTMVQDTFIFVTLPKWLN